MRRTLAIGDLHGCLTSLKTLVECVGFAPDDRLIFLGDYVDRGPDSRGVLEFLIELKKSRPIVTIKGNHEIMMMWARESQEALEKWLSYGGATTLESYGIATLADVPREHWRFMDWLDPFHETETHLFVHANVDPKLSLSAQLANGHIFWEGFDPKKSEPHESGKILICGHTRQPSGRPVSVGHAVCIDTGAYDPEGWLTCLDVDSGEYWQANETGQQRTGALPPRTEQSPLPRGAEK